MPVHVHTQGQEVVEVDLEPAVSPLVFDVLGHLLLVGVAGHDDCA